MRKRRAALPDEQTTLSVATVYNLRLLIGKLGRRSQMFSHTTARRLPSYFNTKNGRLTIGGLVGAAAIMKFGRQRTACRFRRSGLTQLQPSRMTNNRSDASVVAG
jgi:hypothetical protein